MGAKQYSEEWNYTGPGDYMKGYGIFQDEDINNTGILETRKRVEERLIIITDTDLVSKDIYQFRTAKHKMVYPAAHMGINGNYFGGRAVKCGELKDSPYITIVNDDDITIGLLVMKDRFNKFNYQELYTIAKGLNLKVVKTMKKEEIIKVLTNV